MAKLKIVVVWHENDAELLMGEEGVLPAKTNVTMDFEFKEMKPVGTRENVEVECYYNCLICGYSDANLESYRKHQKECHGVGL
jgi:hypothetical protein